MEKGKKKVKTKIKVDNLFLLLCIQKLKHLEVGKEKEEWWEGRNVPIQTVMGGDMAGRADRCLIDRSIFNTRTPQCTPT